jgi:hypothetical protein
MSETIAEPRFVDTISCHSWNQDRTKVALCPGNNQILIYAIKNQDLTQRTLEATLEEVCHILPDLICFWSSLCFYLLSCPLIFYFVWIVD